MYDNEVKGVRVKTFANQDECRASIFSLVSVCVHDILYRLDSATGPYGVDDVSEPPDEAMTKQYEEFRDWFGPEVGASIQSMVVGPLLSRISVDGDGYVSISDERYRHFLPEGDREKARIAWLCVEIPYLIETYGELEGLEREDALACVEQGLNLIQKYSDDRAKRMATHLLPELEQWFLLSQSGSKILRGDQEGLKKFLSGLEAVRERVAELEAERDAAKAAIRGESVEVSQDALEAELFRVEEKITKLEKSLGELDKQREAIIEQMS